MNYSVANSRIERQRTADQAINNIIINEISCSTFRLSVNLADMRYSKSLSSVKWLKPTYFDDK